MRNLSKAAIVAAAVAASALPAPASAGTPSLAVSAQTTGAVHPNGRQMVLNLTCTISGVVQHTIIDQCYTSNGLDAINASGVGPAGAATTAGIVPFGPYTTCVSGRGINLDGKWVYASRCVGSLANLSSLAVATA